MKNQVFMFVRTATTTRAYALLLQLADGLVGIGGDTAAVVAMTQA